MCYVNDYYHSPNFYTDCIVIQSVQSVLQSVLYLFKYRLYMMLLRATLCAYKYIIYSLYSTSDCLFTQAVTIYR